MPARFALVIAAAVSVLVRPDSAFAHEVIPGVSGFAALMLHPFLLADVLFCLACIVLVFARAEAGRTLILVLTLLAGLAPGYGLAQLAQPIPQAWLLTLLTGAAVALVIAGLNRISLATGVVLLCLLGVAVGAATEPESPATRDLVMSLAATGMTCVIVGVGLGRLLNLLRRQWADIGLRIIASWVAAASFLMIALVLFA